jgi:thiosulfate dehydrogenase [quinone] large subunit
MTTTLEPRTSAMPPMLEHMTADAESPASDESSVVTPMSSRVAKLGLLGLRLAIGFEFLWAFLDKTFGLEYHTASAKAWIHGGSPTTGFLSGVNVGPLQGTFHSLAGVTAVDWLFMLGLLGVGVALILGVALRPAAISGGTILLMMYVASWPFAKMGGGAPTASTNPIIDDHIVSFMALVVIGAFAAMSVGAISRRWSQLAFVRSHSWLR